MSKELLDKYVLVVMEYTHNIHNSEIIQNMDNNEVVLAGLKAIIHVFKVAFHITGCVSTTVAITQKAIACYLEYVEQMQKTQFVLNANIVDAITFVYSKTIHELYNGDGLPQNLEDVATMQPFLNHLDYITTTILWTSNPDITSPQRLELAHNYLHKAVVIDTAFPGLPVFKLLEMFQQCVWMDYAVYYELVGEFLKQLKKKQKSISKEVLRNNMLYFLAYLKDKTLDQIALAEGLKSNYDIVARLLS